MTFNIYRAKLEEIYSLRTLFLQESNVQMRYHACHERGWSDSYLIGYNAITIGYAAIKGAQRLSDRNSVFEFYLIPPFRHLAVDAFRELLHISGVKFIECQSNDRFLTSLLYQFGQNISAEEMLFKDGVTTFFNKDEVVFRKRQENDSIFEHKREPVGEYVLEWRKEIVASGGFALYYNMPFADIYLEVDEKYYRKGLGSFLVQELKKECYLEGRVPSARCSINHVASKATLMKAGFVIAGHMLLGSIHPNAITMEGSHR